MAALLPVVHDMDIGKTVTGLLPYLKTGDEESQ